MDGAYKSFIKLLNPKMASKVLASKSPLKTLSATLKDINNNKLELTQNTVQHFRHSKNNKTPETPKIPVNDLQHG